MDLCENLLLLKFVKIAYNLLNVIRIVVPILLIVKLSLDIYHCILNGDAKRITEFSVKRIVAAVIVFLVPTFVSLVLRLIEVGGGSKESTPYCLTSLDNIKYYEQIAEEKKKLKDEERRKKEQLAYEEALKKQKEALINSSQNNGSVDTEAMMVGRKYSLSDTELRGLCGIAEAEQGSIEGAKAEASLMANLYELLPSSSKFYNKGLYNYVLNSGWFASAQAHASRGCSGNYLNAVRDVLVNGNRTLPLYINEHDCYICNSRTCSNGNRGDICSITTNGVNYSNLRDVANRSNYVSNNTKVYTLYYGGGYWIFYSFPASNSDPFGYTMDAKNKIEGMNR